eukprot:Phypoly_transcript_02896.p1 GENE.Phypoly_transcript_02896~~Phypoly_transcript_02896.p1  ORF type:complete len:866 (+),score=110.51 Phypoly_transcript_02896:306-2600(+)
MNSGYVDSAGKAYWTYGRYEVYAKLPAGQGMWPAHWLLSEIRCWPYGFEFDILECPVNTFQQGQTLNINTAHGTLHFGRSCGENFSNGSIITSADLSKGYHTYALEWWPNNATWFLDDVVYHTVEHNSVWKGQPFAMDNTPHFFILNSAVGGWPGAPSASTTFPQYQYIDYVRVYGWQPCTSGCGAHGHCDSSHTLCICDARYFGTNCEYYDGGSYKNTFSAASALDSLVDNAAIGSNLLSLSITATGCPNTCKYTGGKWSYSTGWGSGNFTFVAKTTSTSGTGVLLAATGGDVSGQGFQMVFSGSTPTKVAFQGMLPVYYTTLSLGFDASAAFHTYVIEFELGVSYTLYVDGVKRLTTPSASSVHILPRAVLQYSTTYFGPAVPYTGPIHAYVKEVDYVSSDARTPPTPAPTPKPTPAPTPKPTPAPTPKPTQAPTPKPTPAPTPKPTQAPTPKPTPAPVCTPVAGGTGTGLSGDYFNGTGLDAAHYVATEIDATINFNWGTGKPTAMPSGFPTDYFSVRWTGQVQPLYSGVYTFYASADDGVRLYVNNVLLINEWIAEPLTEWKATMTLTAGQKYNIIVEYLEQSGGAEVILSWSSSCQTKQVIPQHQLYPCISPSPATGNGLLGKYYSDTSFTTQKSALIDKTINFNWGAAGPSVLSPQVDHFSVRWTGHIQPQYSGTYTFYPTSDDGARFYVNGKLLVDAWVSRTDSASNPTGSISLLRGVSYTIQYDYFENTGNAGVELYWSHACQAKTIVPQSQLFSI